MAKINFADRIESDIENPENIKVGEWVCVAQDGLLKEVRKIKVGRAHLRWKWGPKQTYKYEWISLKLLTRDCPPLSPPKIYKF
jgi:hypothetical protein